MAAPFNLKGKYNAIAAIILGTLLASILLIALLITPAWSKLKKLGNEIPAKQSENESVKLDLSSLEKAKDFFQKYGDTVEKVNTAVPLQPEVPSILLILDSLAKQDGVSLTSFAPQQIGTAPTGGTSSAAPGAAAAAPTGGAQSVEITAVYSGRSSDLLRYFYDLERSLRVVDVKSLTISTTRSTDDPNNPVIEGNITFRAYYKPAEGQAASAGTPAPAVTPAPSGGTR